MKRDVQGSSSPPGALGEALGSVVRVLAQRGKSEVGRLAGRGRSRLDLRHLRRDRDIMYQKLGREVRALVEGGEVAHPGLRRGVARLRDMDARIEQEEERAAALEHVDEHVAENEE